MKSRVNSIYTKKYPFLLIILLISTVVWVADMPDASSFIRSLFYSRSASNEFNYKNPTVDRLIEESERELDPEIRGMLIRQIEDIILKDLPMILYERSTLYQIEPKLSITLRC